MDRIPRQMHVLTHAIELDAIDKHFAPSIAMMWPP